MRPREVKSRDGQVCNSSTQLLPVSWVWGVEAQACARVSTGTVPKGSHLTVLSARWTSVCLPEGHTIEAGVGLE